MGFSTQAHAERIAECPRSRNTFPSVGVSTRTTASNSMHEPSARSALTVTTAGSGKPFEKSISATVKPSVPSSPSDFASSPSLN